MIDSRPRRSQYQYAFSFLLLCTLCSEPSLTCAESLELRLTDIGGLTRETDGRTEYMVFVHECSPLCLLMGVESLADVNSAHVISSEGIRGSFRLSITLRRRTRLPPQQRQDIPVEVVEHEGGSIDMLDFSKDTSSMLYSEPLSNFEPYGRVLLTGSNPGEKGNLNDNWRFIDEKVAQFVIDTTISAVRRCRKSCQFSSEASFVKKILDNGTLDKPSFKLQLTAFREGAALKSTPENLLFAGYFAEAAEKSLTQDLILPFPFPRGMENDATRSTTFTDFTDGCIKYRFVSAVGEEIAYVWRLSSVDDNIEHDKLGQLDTGRNFAGTTIVVFKDIPKSNAHYTEIWGRDELLPVSFRGSTPYDHFGSFGKVHKGFLTRYNQIAEELRTWLRPGASVLVAGSFAGGAMAALAFADWLSDSNMDLGMIFGVTFGAAQVGDKLFQRAFREMGKYEPSKASYGFFEQLIAADEHSGRIDISTRFPSTIFESFVPYPGVHFIDCLRSVFPVEKIALSSPGHLRTFRSVGRRRFLFAGRHLRLPDAKISFDRKYTSTSSNDTLRDLAASFFAIDGDRLSHYMERLTSLYADKQQSIHSGERSTVLNSGVLAKDLGNTKGTRDTRCEATEIPAPTDKLSISVEILSTKLNLRRALGVNLCPFCSRSTPFNESLCRPMLYTDNATHPDYGLVPFALPSEPLTFSSLRPTPPQTCVQILLYALRKPHTCATDMLQPEVVRVAMAPLLELVEVVGCTAKQRCGMEFEGMRLMIAAEEEALVERGWEKREGMEGILTREEEKNTSRGKKEYLGKEPQKVEKIDMGERRLQGKDGGTRDGFVSSLDFNERDGEKGHITSGERRTSDAVNEASDGREFNGEGTVRQKNLRSKGSGNGTRSGQLTKEVVGGGRDGGYLATFEEESSAAWDANSDFQRLARGSSFKKGRARPEFDGERRGHMMLERRESTGSEGVLGRGSGSATREVIEGVRSSGGWGGLRRRGMGDEMVDVAEMGGALVRKGSNGKRDGTKTTERVMAKVEDRADANGRGVWWRGGGRAGAGETRRFGRGAGCETERWCECGAVRAAHCVKGIENDGGWCEVGGCVEMRCGCGGGRRCEKKVGFVYEVLGGAEEDGDKVQRCVRKVTNVVVEMV